MSHPRNLQNLQDKVNGNLVGILRYMKKLKINNNDML